MRQKEEKLSNPNDTFINRKEYRCSSFPLEVIQNMEKTVDFASDSAIKLG